MRTILLAATATCALLTASIPEAQARHHRHRHHYVHHKHVDSPIAKAAVEGAKAGGEASTKASGGLVTVNTAADIKITVAASLADKFVGFIADLVAAGHKPKDIGCYASGGHIRGSNHYSGAACDIDQTERDKTSAFMYDVADLTTKWGLTNGCSWGYRDCGHIEVPQHTYAYARNVKRARYAHIRRHHACVRYAKAY